MPDTPNQTSLVPVTIIERRIYLLRRQKVMISTDLAELYGVEPRVLVQAVKRNIERFPADFMFQLTREESRNLKSQIVTSSWGGARRASPYAFTQEGVAMLSTVLRSRRAVQVSIAIMRAFVRLRELLASNRDLAEKLEAMERQYDSKFRVIFDVIHKLLAPPESPKEPIGFRGASSPEKKPLQKKRGALLKARSPRRETRPT